MKHPTIEREDAETFHLTIHGSMGIMAQAEILQVGDDDHDDAPVCFATNEVDLALTNEHLARLLLVLTEFFVGKREEFGGDCGGD